MDIHDWILCNNLKLRRLLKTIEIDGVVHNMPKHPVENFSLLCVNNFS